MNKSGYVYVLVNPSMPGLCKVGRTSRTPDERAREVSGGTGVPQHFITVYSEQVEDCDAAEKAAHSELERRGYRLSSNREFFQASPSDVIRSLITVLAAFRTVEGAGPLPSQASDCSDPMTTELDSSLVDAEAEGERLYELAELYSNGSDEILKDSAEALRLYEQSAALGYGLAAYSAGRAYQRGLGAKPNPQKAMTFFKRAVALGGSLGYIGMADLFTSTKQLQAASKCWKEALLRTDYLGWWQSYIEYLAITVPEPPQLLPRLEIEQRVGDLRAFVLGPRDYEDEVADAAVLAWLDAFETGMNPTECHLRGQRALRQALQSSAS